MNKSKAYLYCKNNIKKKTTPKYVKLQMKDFMKVCEDKNKKYIVSKKKLKQIENILKLLRMPKGLKAGQSLFECSTGYQWLFYTAILCTVHRDDLKKRRYQTGVLEIARKNYKTYTIATIFIILFITEPKFSEFYSVAPDGTISRVIKKAISEILQSSPLIFMYNDEPRFRLLRDYILFKPTQSTLTPLSFSTNRMDSRFPKAFIVDEAGALPNNYAIEAMYKGQTGIDNKLAFIISTMYSTVFNPFIDEITLSKRSLDGINVDETRFSLLYEPDDPKNWETDDNILRQANPASLEVPEVWEDLKKARLQAILIENKREEFLTKNCNIIYQNQAETFINVKDVQSCKVANIDWNNKDVYIGLDLSESDDNTSVSMVTVDDENNILAKSWAFIPEDRIEEKTQTEKVNYTEQINKGNCFKCGDRIIDYSFIEYFILHLEEKYNVNIVCIGYDKWNARSTANKLSTKYTTIEIRQHSSTLHPPTKLLKESILQEKFQYTENKLLEINFQNSKCTYDTNKNMYVNKKKSSGKVDMVVSLINAIYLLQQDVDFNSMDFIIQTI